MSIKLDRVRRIALGFAAVALGVAGLLPAVLPQHVSAAGQVSLRSIQMSDSGPGATNVSYKFAFTPATTAAQSIVIDFCSNSSIIGGTCNAVTGMDAKTSIAFTAGTGTASWVKDTASALSTTNRILVNMGSGAQLGTSAVDFTITGITNSTTTGSFWARMYTYANTSYGAYASPTSLGTYLDYGGFALSTVTLINITATVMETLTFCVSKAAPAAGCTTLTAPTLTLGHGSPQVLDSSQVDTDTAFTQISTNAINGAVVRMKTRNTCTGLSRDGGATCPIAGQGAFGTIAAATAKFGLNVANGTGGTGTVNANANYGTTAGSYGMGANVTSTYGDPIMDTNNTATSNVNSQLTFAAQASVTTPAGVYSANESLIATGTF